MRPAVAFLATIILCAAASGQPSPDDILGNVLPDEELLRRQPDFALLLAWNFADEIMKNLEEYRLQGGHFIIPIPSPRVVS